MFNLFCSSTNYQETFRLDVSNEEAETNLTLFPAWQNKNVRFNIREKSYELDYKVKCKWYLIFSISDFFRGFFGKDCDIVCIPSPDDHYSCSATGEKICHKGWTGPECDQSRFSISSNVNNHSEENHCSNIVCQNGGICQSEEFNSCSCPSGFEGIFCERRTKTVLDIKGELITKLINNLIIDIFIVSSVVILTLVTIIIVFLYKRSKLNKKTKTAAQYVAKSWKVRRLEETVETGTVPSDLIV